MAIPAPDTVGVPSEAGAPASGAPASGRAVVRDLLRRPGAAIAVVVLGLIGAMALTAPLLAGLTGWDQYSFDPSAIDSYSGGLPRGGWGGISGEHWFGVEPGSGRDMFMRIAYGARVSLAIAISATLLTTTVGVVLGTLAGYFGGWVDTALSRAMDFLMAFPALIFMIALLSALPGGNRPVLLVLVLSVFGWPYTARVVRGQALSLRNQEFVEAARASGASRWAIVFREVLPNLRGTIVVLATLAVPSYVATEAGLSFLGVGVTPPTPSWGQMIASAATWYAVDPLFLVIPGAFLFATVVAFTVIGDHLKSILDEGAVH